MDSPSPMYTEVLLDRAVPLIDELAEFVKQRGEPSLASILDDLRERAATVPAELDSRARHAASQRAITTAILRYRKDVEAPAAAALRELKAASPSTVRKVALGGRDAAVVAALEPGFSQLSEAPLVSSLELRVSPELSADAAHKYAAAAVVAGVHLNIIAMYVGPHRPGGMPSPGFYLVYDIVANSLAAVPQLPSFYISWFSHRSIGSAVAVLCFDLSDYLLVELLTRNNSRGLPTNNATLCMWWSSGPTACRWIRKELVLPLPPIVEGYTFCADTVLVVGSISICWVDLLMGILVCDDMLATEPVFRFIPLPPQYGTEPYPSRGRGLPEEYRSCNVNLSSYGRVINFVSLDGYREGVPSHRVMLTTWTVSLDDPESMWLKQWSCTIGDISLPSNPNVSLCSMATIRVKCPLLSVLYNDVVYLNMTLNMTEVGGEMGEYCITMCRGRIMKFAPRSGSNHKFVTYVHKQGGDGW